MDSTEVAIGLGTIVVFGVGALWLARLARIPSIVLLLLAGILAGPITGLVDPEALFGDTLDAGVSLAVGLLLFDSGQSLVFRRLKTGRRAVRRLVLIGAAITWAAGAVAAYFLFDISKEVAALLGAVLVVSGPTVVGPILDLARPREPIDSVLRWEGTILDPVGGALGVVVLSAITASGLILGPGARMLATAGVGIGIGAVCAFVLVIALRYMTIPDDLQVPVAFMFAVLAFTAANIIFPEAGLFATLTLGLVLANQRIAYVHEIRKFQASIGTLIIAMLFVVLAATINLSDLIEVLVPSIALLAVLVVIVRPLATFVSGLRTKLAWRDRAFAACVAPRGIVAASTVSFYAISLDAAGMEADAIVPITFAVIIGAGLVYGFGAPLMAHVLRVARGVPKGVVLCADESIVGPLANALTEQNVPVLVVTSRSEEPDKTQPPYAVFTGDLHADEFQNVLRSNNIGSAVIATVDHEHDVVAAERCVTALGSRNVFYVPRGCEVFKGGLESLWQTARPKSLVAFAPDISHARFKEVAGAGDPVWIDTVDGDWAVPDGAVPLFIVTDEGRVIVSTPRALARARRSRRGACLLVSAVPDAIEARGAVR